MDAQTGTAVRAVAAKRGSRLRFPKLFALIVLLLIVDLLVPDMVPFVDEIILGLLATVLGMLRERREEPPLEKAERVD